MEFSYEIGLWALGALIVGSVLFGMAIQLVGTAHLAYEWVLTALATGIGAFVASEFIVGFQTWEPVFDGLALVPAVVVGVITGLIVAGASRFLMPEAHARPVS